MGKVGNVLYELVSKGDFPVTTAPYIGVGDKRLDEVLESINQAQSTTNQDIADLDERVTELEEHGGGGGNYPPESGIPESDLSAEVKQKLNRDLGTQCLYELDGTTLNITTLESGLGTQCYFVVDGDTLNISTIGGDPSA